MDRSELFTDFFFFRLRFTTVSGYVLSTLLYFCYDISMGIWVHFMDVSPGYMYYWIQKVFFFQYYNSCSPLQWCIYIGSAWGGGGSQVPTGGVQSPPGNWMLLIITQGAHCIKLLPEKNSGKIWKLRLACSVPLTVPLEKKLRLK